MEGVGALGALEQLQCWEASVNDPRGRIGTGWQEVDDLLNRGGLAPSTLVILGGRTHTRKTTLAMNLIANMLRSGVPVGLVGLDESPASYTAKLASALSGVNHERLEQEWSSDGAREAREEYLRLADGFTLSRGHRPNFDHLSAWLDAASVGGVRPKVVFVDYISLLTRDKYAGAEIQRVMRLIEELQVWTSKEEVITICLHQENRGTNAWLPSQLDDLKFGGEEIADIVFTTFRPELDPLGNATPDQAEAMLGDRYDEDKYLDAKARVARNKGMTYLQLLKNRPGTRLCHQGVRLKSHGDSQKMVPASESVGSDMTRRPLEVVS